MNRGKIWQKKKDFLKIIFHKKIHVPKLVGTICSYGFAEIEHNRSSCLFNMSPSI